MSADEQNADMKAGHPPALKVSGMRVTQRPRRHSEESSKTSKADKSDAGESSPQDSSYSPFVPHALVTGVPQKNDDTKESAKREMKQAHEKPLPVHQIPHTNKMNIIQQPKK